MPDSIVYVVQEPPPVYRTGRPPIFKDLSSAQRYGRIEYVLDQSDQPSLTPGPCLHKVSRVLRTFNPTNDYLCYAGGDPLSIAFAMIALKEMNFAEVSLLRWDRERDTDGVRTYGGFYTPVSVKLRL